MGYTPQLATAVMYVRGDGNDNLNCTNKNGKNCIPGYLVPYFGAEYPTKTWTDVMRMSLDGAPVEQFPPPANVKATKNDHVPLPTFTPTPTPTQQPTEADQEAVADADADPDAHADADADAHADPDASPDPDGPPAEPDREPQRERRRRWWGTRARASPRRPR